MQNKAIICTKSTY